MRRSTSHSLPRLVALTWALLGLFVATAHVHGDAHSGPLHADGMVDAPPSVSPLDSDEFPTVSSDDAHHEHSSTKTLVLEVCAGCRSRSELDWAIRSATRNSVVLPERAGRFSVYATFASATRVRRHPARAPPIAHA